MGVLSSFAIFSAVGAISNVGSATHVMGDVGTNVGAFTGFSPEMISGQIHIADAVSAQAAQQIQQSYQNIFNLPSRAILPALLGSGQILRPNVYSIGSAASLTGNLTFDAQNDSKAIFVIKINGAFSAAALAKISLLNGASLSNIYWQIGGRADMATGAIFQGTILVDGAIGLGNAASFQGRVFSRSGAVTLYNNTMDASGLSGAKISPLPVELTSFTAVAQGASARLAWNTASEKNSAYFAVERSTDGQAFTTLARMPAQGTSTQAHAYAWTDAAPSPATTVYYRLRQVDTDNTTSYSPVRRLTPAGPATISLGLQAYPNPGQPGQIPQVLFEAAQNGLASLRMSDALGHLLLEHTLPVLAGTNTLPLAEAAALPTGLYLIQLRLGNQTQTLRLVRQ